uniref:Uncharacterized protein n=1 Tax=Opuntia streptacantha TaxID=393608 RepID=A0A7C9DGA8_OPUST
MLGRVWVSPVFPFPFPFSFPSVGGNGIYMLGLHSPAWVSLKQRKSVFHSLFPPPSPSPSPSLPSTSDTNTWFTLPSVILYKYSVSLVSPIPSSLQHLKQNILAARFGDQQQIIFQKLISDA